MFNRNACTICLLVVCVSIASGCGCFEGRHRKPPITALSASPGNCEPPGIPFYLPKPLLVISKNFYHVEDAKVGLTGTAPIPGSFDEQETYADVNLNGSFSRTSSSNMGGGDSEGGEADGAMTSSLAHAPTLHSSNGIPSAPGSDAIPSDGLGPHMFYTYEIVFVPDLTQKYMLQVNGGPGEIRAAMNLVNGWQFTGLGPYYLKDSSTAQNIISRGVAANLGLGGASDVINSVANLKSLGGSGGTVDTGAIADLALALDEAKKEQVFNTSCIPMDLWSTKTVRNEDGKIEVIKVPPRIEKYAQIAVYEARVEGGHMLWSPVAQHDFDREYLGVMEKRIAPMATTTGDAPSEEGQIPGDDEASGASEEGFHSAEPIPSPPGAATESAAKGMLQMLLQPPVSSGAAAADGPGLDSGLDQPLQGVTYMQGTPAPVQFITPEVTGEVVARFLPEPVEPRESWLEKLSPCKKRVVANQKVNSITQ
ncbi:hypothetical protein [Aeoliella mucimassa]|uniref:Uncharacterized protein n=1 Tax=Aeoliella mucimassa TaxID=2527972 RepID=A0A518AHB9_9BACT|nr:hypothetical protein [Aeoliella mucimassa]QDU54128.1 hypothetical protein Pan181_03080 [Aeoliella mucimassa]